MEPIIDPMIFYIEYLLNVFKFVAFLACTVSVGSIVLAIVCGNETATLDPLSPEATKTFLIVGIIGLCIFLPCCVFVPNGKLYLKMKVAENITPDNLKAIQGYTKEVKESIKADIIDIINSVDERQREEK